MRLLTCSIVLWVSASLLGLGTGDAEAKQRYRSYRGHRSYGVSRYHGGYHHYRAYRGAYRSHSYGRYRSYYRPYYRYGSYYGYRPSYRAYYRPSFSVGWGWPGWGYSAWPYVSLGVSYSPAVQVYSGGPTKYSSYSGAVRTLVNPKQAEVWLDGYYSGTVDDFDGSYQRLYMPPGEHEISLQLDGYRTYREVIQISTGHTYKLRHEMVPLGPGETTAPPPETRTPPSKPPIKNDAYREPPPQAQAPPEPQSPASPPPQQQQIPKQPEPRPIRAPSRFGMLSLRVQPTDAQVYIDGELWGSLEGFEELPIHLPVGRHQIGIRRQGFESFETEVEIHTGVVTPLHVKLDGGAKL